MQRTSKSTQRGASLIELAVAVTVLVVALIGTVAAIASSSALARQTNETYAAQRAAASILEELRATPFDDVVDTFDGTTRTLPGIAGSPGTAAITLARVDDGTTSWAVYEARVVVSWTGGGAARSMELRTYVSDRARGSGLYTAPVVTQG